MPQQGAFRHCEISRSPVDRSSKVTTVPGHGPTVARTPGNLCGRNTGGHMGVRGGAASAGQQPAARQSRAARPRVHTSTDTAPAVTPHHDHHARVPGADLVTRRRDAMTASDTWAVPSIVTRDTWQPWQPPAWAGWPWAVSSSPPAHTLSTSWTLMTGTNHNSVSTFMNYHFGRTYPPAPPQFDLCDVLKSIMVNLPYNIYHRYKFTTLSSKFTLKFEVGLPIEWMKNFNLNAKWTQMIKWTLPSSHSEFQCIILYQIKILSFALPIE